MADSHATNYLILSPPHSYPKITSSDKCQNHCISTNSVSFSRYLAQLHLISSSLGSANGSSCCFSGFLCFLYSQGGLSYALLFFLGSVSSLLLTPEKLMVLVFLGIVFFRESQVLLSRIQACLESHSLKISRLNSALLH